jgi:hypothetical protein
MRNIRPMGKPEKRHWLRPGESTAACRLGRIGALLSLSRSGVNCKRCLEMIERERADQPRLMKNCI